MKFSIITPSLNQVEYLGVCLDSVCRQQGDFEIEHLIRDGGSGDGTRELLAARDGVEWVTEPDRGQSDAINKGLARARGDVLAYLCADDFYEPGALARVAQEFAAHPEVDVIFGDYYFLEGRSGWKRLKKTGPFSEERLRRGNFIGQPAVFWRRRVYERFGGFDPELRYCMDHEYWLRLAGKTIWHHVPVPLAVARLHGSSKTSSQLTRMWQEAAEMGMRYGVGEGLRRSAFWMGHGGQWYYQAKRCFFSGLGILSGRGPAGEKNGGKPVLLVLEFHHLGDAVLALPFLRGALERYRVVVGCRPVVADFYRRALPGLEILAAEPPWLPGGQWRHLPVLLAQLRRLAPELAVSVWPDPRVQWLMQWSRARKRLGLAVRLSNMYAAQVPGRFNKMCRGLWLGRVWEAVTGRSLLNEALDKTDPNQAHIEGWRQMADRMGTAWRPEVPWLRAGEIQNRSVADFFQRAETSGLAVAVIHAGAGSEDKRWPVERFQAVAGGWLKPEGFAVLWVDDGHVEVPEGETAVATTDLSELIAVLARADLVLANDSFPAHLAAALGRRVFTIFSSSEPRWFAPYGNGAGVVQRDLCPHRPCLSRCVQPSYLCRDGVEVADVIKTLSREWTKTP